MSVELETENDSITLLHSNVENSRPHSNVTKRVISYREAWKLNNLIRAPNITKAMKSHNDSKLERVLGPIDLIGYGLGSTVGAGIFVVYGVVANEKAGPAVVLSFLFAAFSSLLSALCYSEFAARVPLSGSAYTFSYVSLGELVGWFIGWNLTLEYGFSAAAVARGWSSYLVQFLRSVGVYIPSWLAGETVVGGYFQPAPFAALICGICTIVLLAGVRESSHVNNIVTGINVSLIVFIVLFGSFHIENVNYEDFTPYGWSGVFEGSGMVFFSFIGFDSVSTLAGEVRDPGRNLPIGIVGTLAIATVLYCSVSLVMCGMIRFDQIDIDAPLAESFRQIGYPGIASVVGLGAVTTLTATTLCSLLGQPRIFFQMARDGLLFKIFGKVSKKRHVPVFGTVFTGVGAAILGCAMSIDELTSVISVGTLCAFGVVCGGLIVLRYAPPVGDMSRRAARQRWLVPTLVASLGGLALLFSMLGKYVDHWAGYLFPFLFFLGIVVYIDRACVLQPTTAAFTCPLMPYIPALGLLVNCYLLGQLDIMAFVRLLIWTSLGMLIYAFYGIRHSKLNYGEITDSEEEETEQSTLIYKSSGVDLEEEEI